MPTRHAAGPRAGHRAGFVHRFEHPIHEGVVPMNTQQLQRDFREAQTRAKALLDRATQQAADEGRTTNDHERAAIQAVVDEAKNLKARIDRATSDASMSEAIERMTGGLSATPSNGPRDLRSLGAQFAADPDYWQFIKAGGHRRAGGWTSPAVELKATTLTEGAGSGGPLVIPDYQPGVVPLPLRPPVVADQLSGGPTTSNAIITMRQKTFTNAAAAVAEGGTKPESTLVYEQVTDPVQKLAHWIPVSEEFLEDVGATVALIDTTLIGGLLLTEEDQLLNGSGVAPNLLGLLNRPGLAPDVARGTNTNADSIAAAVSAIQTATNLAPTGVIVHPTNWETILLSKDTNGQYYGSGPFAAPGAATLWGLPVTKTTAIAAGTALVVCRTAAMVFRRGGVRIESSNSHASFFTSNLVAIRAEERLALAVMIPAAFGKVTGLN